MTDPDSTLQRQFERTRRLMTALMRHPRHGEVEIVVRDVSEQGLGGRCKQDVAVGETVTIFLGEGTVAGKIVWRKGQSFGVHLDTPIDPAAVKPLPEKSPITEPYQVPERFRPSGDSRRPGFRPDIQSHGQYTRSKW